VRIPKSKALYVSAATALTLLGSTAAAYGGAYKTVTVQDNGQRKIVKGFASGSLASFLKAQGVVVTKDDHVHPGLSSSVSDGMQVVIEHPVTVHLMDGRAETDIVTYAHSVNELFAEQNIVLGAADHVEVPMNATLQDGETIVIHRRETNVRSKTQVIPFQTIRQRTDQLFQGQEHVLTYGVKGLLELKTTSVFVDGRQLHAETSKSIQKQPVAQVIEIGTKPRTYSISSRSSSPGLIERQITVVATAYCGGGRTATGEFAGPGVIAVDPRVIPLGTKLYVPGVGIVHAEDTGGAIVGNRIDVWFSTEAQAVAWGVRTITIYVVQ